MVTFYKDGYTDLSRETSCQSRPSLANPAVTRELDEIVMTALDRHPSRRWQSAAAMRDRIREVIAQPGNAIDDRAVVEWVNWVLAQKRGRPPQLTPIVPMPIRSPSTATDFDEATEATVPDLVLFSWTIPNLVWTACAGATALLLVVSLIWRWFG